MPKNVEMSGNRLSIYVSNEDEALIQRVHDILDKRTQKGLRTSLSAVFLEVLEKGLDVVENSG